jgi:hypothetical protein
MKLEEIDHQILEHQEKHISQQRLVLRLGDLKQQIRDGEVDITTKKKKMEDEQQDVHRLENLSVKQIFTKILGSTEQELERERQEYLDAVYEYNTALDHLEAVNYEYDLLVKKRESEQVVKPLLDELIGEKEIYLKRRSGEISKAIREYDTKIRITQSHLKDQEEALVAGEDCYVVLAELYNGLVELRNMMERARRSRQGVFSSYRKEQILKQSTRLAAVAQTRLNLYKKELFDVFKAAQVNFDISSFDEFVRKFYQFFVMNWVKRQSLYAVIQNVNHVNGQVQHFQRELEAIKKAHQDFLDELLKDKRNYIIAAK